MSGATFRDPWRRDEVFSDSCAATSRGRIIHPAVEFVSMHDVNALVGSHDLLLLTLATLRYDVAQDCLRAGRTPNLARVLPPSGWEARHSPGSFTYAAHQAFFAGFLPTPPAPGKHPRPFALRFPGSETVTPRT